MKKVLLIAALLAAALGLGARAEGLSVVAANFPCYDFARQVAGDRGDVRLLIHPGVEVHSYDPSPADILSIGQADLFVYIGGESDAWADSILDGFGEGGGPAVLRMMAAVTPIEEEGDAVHEAPEYDEHIWTSPKNAAAMVNALADSLCEIDPDGADAYRAAAADYAGQIDAVGAELSDIVNGAARRELVFADRFPFLYLVREYGLDYAAAFPSCTADTEPTPQTMMGLIRRVVNDHIPVIYTIELSTGAVARAVAEETGAKVMELHSMQTVTQAQFDAGETWVSLMRRNVEAIREGLN